MSTEMIAYLDFVDSKDVSHRVEIRKDKLSMGRAYGNDLRIEDTRISRNHAEIVSLDNNKHVFRDRESKCGSFINGIKIREKVLNVGDIITLGGTHTTRLTFGYLPKLQGGLESMNTTSNALSNLDAFFGIKDSTTVITEQQTRFLNAALIQQPEYVSNRTLSNLMALYQISHRILPIKSVLELAEVWLEQLFKALPVERGAIFLFNQSKNQLEIIVSHNQKKETIEVSTKHPVIEHSFTNNVAIHSDSSSVVEKFSKSSEFAKNVSSLLCAPISTSLRVWGVCYLDSSKKELNLEDLEFLMATARQAGLVIENLELQEQLMSSDRLITIGKLTSGISHEIRNRLALLTGAEFIEMKYSHDPDVKIFTEMVKMGQQRALALVDEIRAFARNRNDEFVKSRLSIVRTIEKALSILKLDSSAMKRAIDFYYDCEPIVPFNEAKIEQVIINLIRNAIEATKEDIGKIIITLTTNQAEVLIRISDNGMGIPTDTLERIWEPFFTTKGEEGTGLGLEICRRIIESHRGNIKCESQVGKGTTFIVSLPVNPG
jgi:nitrogen-specific signal transduction histidine kinase/pSer/pThr/pTyr-binding forkhead associated (FHA) protein